MNRKWFELIFFTLAFALAYYLPVQTAKLPVFYGQFNTLDGSFFAVRFMDLVLSATLLILASRRLIPASLDRRSLLRISVTFIIMLAAASIIEWAWDALVLRAFNLPIGPGEVSDKMLAYPRRETLELTIIPGNLLAIALGIFYGLIRDRNRQLRRQQILEKQNLESEVKYLRSQINPHFLFNTLNNIYAITQRNEDQQSSDALLRLSSLMRYMLYDSEADSIELDREVEHLQNYIDLMMLKYGPGESPEVSFHKQGRPEQQSIAPVLLLPFVENAFKHGVDSRGRGSIEISLVSEPGRIGFTVINSKSHNAKPQDNHQGVGLENVEQRLAYLYTGRYELDIDEDDEEYRIRLEIRP